MNVDDLLSSYIEDNADPELPDDDNAHFGALLLIADVIQALAERGYVERRIDARNLCDGAFDYFIQCGRGELSERASARALARTDTRCKCVLADANGAQRVTGAQAYLLPELQPTSASAQGSLFG